MGVTLVASAIVDRQVVHLKMLNFVGQGGHPTFYKVLS